MMIPRTMLRSWFRFAAALVWLGGIAVLSGCAASFGPFTSAETTRIQNGEAAAVFLRLIGTDQRGITRQPLKMDFEHDPIDLGLGDFETAGEPRHFPYRVPSDAAWDDGWIMLLLRPGYYYLALQAPRRTDIVTYERQLARLPVWRIEVSARTPVIYAGTFMISETTEPGIFGPLWVGINADATGVRDESAVAAQLVARDLPGLPAPVTRLAVRHTGPIRLGIP